MSTLTLYGKTSPSEKDGLTPRDSQFVVVLFLAAGLLPKSIQYLNKKTLIFWFDEQEVKGLGVPSRYGDFEIKYTAYVSAQDEWRARLATAKTLARGLN